MRPPMLARESRSDIASWITLRWTRGTRYYRAHLEQGLWSCLVADAGPRSHRHAVGPRSRIVIALPGDGVDGTRLHHQTPAAARL